MFNLPVVVGARMSLSFPVLISAVPLYAIDFSLKENSGDDPRPERCWFSDGGICSNFPVHFFDEPLPRWPTFAINLKAPHPDYPNDLIRMAQRNSGGVIEGWTRFDDAESGIGKFAGFFSAIMNAMQNWADNMQTHLPGYRDRVVHVCLKPEEGGLNLNMPEDLIKSLSERGLAAADMLIARFAEADSKCELTWENHRWVRYRTTMALIEEMLKKYRTAFNSSVDGDRSYGNLIGRELNDPPKSYHWKREQQEFAANLTEQLLTLAETWDQTKSKFSEGAPKPRAELRIRPRV
jgi:hypothetical protein